MAGRVWPLFDLFYELCDAQRCSREVLGTLFYFSFAKFPVMHKRVLCVLFDKPPETCSLEIAKQSKRRQKHDKLVLMLGHCDTVHRTK